MKDILQKLLESDTETEILEFKSAERQFDKDKLGRYFSALSNEANIKGKSNAWIIFGVTDSKDICGTIISNKQINEYKLEVRNNTSPNLGFIDVHEVKTAHGRVLMLEIPAAPKGMPVAWKGHYYGRDGESLGALNIDELERIRLQSKGYDWSAQIVENACVKDLSERAIEKARIQFVEKNPNLKMDIKNWDTITFLNKAKITIKGKITNTAILLLGKSESEHYLKPAISKITWILKDRDNIEKDYEHFTCPLFLNVSKVYSKIRNIKYRYLQEGTLFPDEVDQYDPYTIREALNNCIAHQDYTLGGKIILVEREDGILVFSNSGDFIPGSVENVINSDAPENCYRNSFLANAMVNLNMIDTIGSGIKKLFVIQKNKFFPLPEYSFKNKKVKLVIVGKVDNPNYSRKLAQMPELNLFDTILLDKVAKNKVLKEEEIKHLKARKLIEGRKPNFHISSSVAKAMDEKESYIKHKGLDDDYYMKLIQDYLKKFNVASRVEIEKLLFDKFSDVLSLDQKSNKTKNLLQKLKKSGKIRLNDKRKWILDGI